MRLEFSNNYHEFFKGAIDELQKTIMMKLYAMRLCNEVFDKWMRKNSMGFPLYDIHILSNR